MRHEKNVQNRIAHHLLSSVSSGWKAVANRFLERTATETFSTPLLTACSLGVSLKQHDLLITKKRQELHLMQFLTCTSMCRLEVHSFYLPLAAILWHHNHTRKTPSKQEGSWLKA